MSCGSLVTTRRHVQEREAAWRSAQEHCGSFTLQLCAVASGLFEEQDRYFFRMKQEVEVGSHAPNGSQFTESVVRLATWASTPTTRQNPRNRLNGPFTARICTHEIIAFGGSDRSDTFFGAGIVPWCVVL